MAHIFAFGPSHERLSTAICRIPSCNKISFEFSNIMRITFQYHLIVFDRNENSIIIKHFRYYKGRVVARYDWIIIHKWA